MILSTRSVDSFVLGRASHGSRKGLTLMELVVVLSVLVALAAIVIPLLPNLLRRAHKATDCTQTNELAKMTQLYQSLYFGYPNGLDSLVDETGAFPTYMAGATSTPGAFGGFAKPGNLVQADIDALGRSGISMVNQLISTTTGASFQPTLHPYAEGAFTASQVTPLVPGSTFAIIDLATAMGSNPNFLQTDLGFEGVTLTGATVNNPNGTKYIVLGVGARNTMVSRVMQDAPMSTPQDNGFTPADTYSRFGLIFKVAGKEVNTTERARLIAVCALEDDELEVTEKDIMGYYDLVKTGQ